MWADGLLLGTSLWVAGASLRMFVTAAAALAWRRPPRGDPFGQAVSPRLADLVRLVLALAGLLLIVWFVRGRASPPYRTLFDVSLEAAGLCTLAAESFDARTTGRVIVGLCVTAGLVVLGALFVTRLLRGTVFPLART